MPSAQPVVQLFSNPHAGRRRAGRMDVLARAFETQGAKVVRSVSAGGPPQIAQATSMRS